MIQAIASDLHNSKHCGNFPPGRKVQKHGRCFETNGD